MKLSACMIVKNEASVLEKTLPVLSKAVDEIILVDTGSSDQTIEVAKKYGAKVFHFKWSDDFSAARNVSLEHAASDWIIWIDADEFISAEDQKAIRATLENSREDAYYLPMFECKYGTQEGKPNFYYRLKIFRNHKGIHFERPFNEQLFDAAGEPLATQGFVNGVRLCHWGKDLSKEKTQSKKERNFRILKECLEKNPNDTYYRYMLANNAQDIGDKELALAEYSKIIELEPNGPLTATAHTRRAKYLIDENKYNEAYSDLKAAAGLEPWNAEIFNLIGFIYLSIGNVDKAIKVLEQSSKLKAPQNVVMGFDISQYTYYPHFLLGNAHLFNNDKAKALAEYKIAYRYNASPALKSRIAELEEK